MVFELVFFSVGKPQHLSFLSVSHAFPLPLILPLFRSLFALRGSYVPRQSRTETLKAVSPAILTTAV